ncbi:MAG: class I mannose-6-phosphate isomerase [Bacteroidales bacterium]|jgi:mannose-6-phosphate isomerase|nr:class I mannose-6-phosphate isomerase [Bacteroidales bacterium]
MDKSLYPLKFTPLMKNKIWGGDKIKSVLGIDFDPLENCGELWVLSGIEGEETPVANGFLEEATLPELIEMYSDELLGEDIFTKYYNAFPLLLKIIDANDDLSIQVHPDDKYAQRQGFLNGKTEMWYIIDSEGGLITSGFRSQVTKAKVINAIRDNKLTELLNIEPAFADDVFYIPSGTIHAIGKGVLLAEIQQSSDLTYRLYDYDRTDANGNKRELHLADAIEVLDLSSVVSTAKHHYHNHLNHTHNILEAPYFITNAVFLNMQEGLCKDYSQLDSCVIYFCVGGSANIQSMNTLSHIKAGETLLLPAIAKDATIFPEGKVKILEIIPL